ncbi:hypothetical protein RF11_01550 [Thelohanellus kitauei]|uniref:C2H2-type domain-containing protein n=1 Tax=Thelohanellus kitauei TaxID=669202 RepID=A0A0C2MXT4_THEKT|nr:hypothetical protein RF11_01550 [Thelohanellus kitauei]
MDIYGLKPTSFTLDDALRVSKCDALLIIYRELPQNHVISKENDRSDPQPLNIDENNECEKDILLAKSESSELNLKSNADIQVNVPELPGVTPSGIKHQRYNIYIEYEDKKPHVCYASTDNATDIMFDKHYSYIKEPVEFDEGTIKRNSFKTTQSIPISMDKKSSCEKISVFLKSKADLKDLYLGHCKIKPFKCDVINCNSRFSLKGDLNRHLKQHSLPIGYKFPFCDYFCNQVDTMNQNVVFHKELNQNNTGL